MKKNGIFPVKSHCGFPEQFPLLQKSLSHLPQEQSAVNHHVQSHGFQLHPPALH